MSEGLGVEARRWTGTELKDIEQLTSSNGIHPSGQTSKDASKAKTLPRRMIQDRDFAAAKDFNRSARAEVRANAYSEAASGARECAAHGRVKTRNTEVLPTTPNVRAKRVPTAGRQGPG